MYSVCRDVKGGGGDSLEGRDYHPSSYYSGRGKSRLFHREVIVSTDSYDTLNTAAFASQPKVFLRCSLLNVQFPICLQHIWFHFQSCFCPNMFAWSYLRHADMLLWYFGEKTIVNDNSKEKILTCKVLKITYLANNFSVSKIITFA